MAIAQGLGSTAAAQSAPAEAPAQAAAFSVDIGLDVSTAAVRQSKVYWDAVNAIVPGADFKSDFTYAEGFAKLHANPRLEVAGDVTLYGGASAIASFTLGEDLFGSEDVTALGLDELYAGFKAGQGDGFWLDISGGRMAHAVGNGGVIYDGGIDGSRTGALLLMPYKAWAQAAVVKLGYKAFRAEAFFLDAHEIATPDGETALAGLDFRYETGPKNFVGLTVGEVVHSLVDYPQSLPNNAGIVPIANGRDGMRFVNAYALLKSPIAAVPSLFVSADFAYQWHKRFDMAAYVVRFRIGKTFAAWPLKPTISYGFSYASGDDADTPQLERYDPVLGGGNDWSVGTTASQLIGNSNINVHRFQVDTVLSPRDFLTLKYFIINANQLNSPLAFNPETGAAPPFLVIKDGSGLRDFGLEYAHVFNRALTVSATAYYSDAGSGLENFAGVKLSGWFADAIVLTFKL